MIITYIRSSSYNNWDFCQMQYFITYVLGYQAPSGKKAQLGTMVHKVMEVLAGCKKMLQDDAGRIYIDDGIGEVKFNKRGLFTDKFMLSLLDRSMEYYKQDCVHNYYPADYRFCKEMCEIAISEQNGAYDPRNRNVVDPEPHFDIPIEEDWGKFKYYIGDEVVEGQLAIKGTIDLVTEIDDDTIEVIDWKTGQRKDWASGEVKDYDKLMKDPQLMLYDYAISKLYPQYNSRFMSIFYLRDGGPFTVVFTDEDRELFMNMLRARFIDIKKNTCPKPISKNRTDWKCTRICHYGKNNWPGTDIMMCKYVEQQLKAKGLDETVKNLTKPGHSVGYYENPG